MKNPWMSMWLSAANKAAGSGPRLLDRRGGAAAEGGGERDGPGGGAGAGEEEAVVGEEEAEVILPGRVGFRGRGWRRLASAGVRAGYSAKSLIIIDL